MATINGKQFEYILSEVEKGRSADEVTKELNIHSAYLYNFLKGQDIITSKIGAKERNIKIVTEEEKSAIIDERNYNYARAKELREQWYFKKIRKIADDESKDGAKGNKGQNSVKRAQLRIDVLKWELGRMSSPKVYEPIEVQKESESESKVNIVLNLKKDE